ncbi:S8 family peptidase [Candidatus Parcubacteria bacterium]|nr:S8 family peptidase [Candidatus Parcubacteria bacterium]
MLRLSLLASLGLVLSCAQHSLPYPILPEPFVEISGGAETRTVYELRTISFALDRIDQRGLPLDHTYRHAGTGYGVTVYVFDGGVQMAHPELSGRVRIGYTPFPNDPKLCNGHGTAVAGAIAGKTLGVAPGAMIVDVKTVLCDRLRGSIRSIVEGALWAIKDHEEHPGPALVNWSFIVDTLQRIPSLDSAVAALNKAGMAVIVSAGNVEMNACKISPANAGGAIVVGSSSIVHETDDPTSPMVDRRSIGTAWGPCVDIFAPGDSVLLPSFDKEFNPSVQIWSGTSMSTGYVSGAAALFLERNPKATPLQVLKHLWQSSTPNAVGDTFSPFPRMLYVGSPAAPIDTSYRICMQGSIIRRRKC